MAYIQTVSNEILIAILNHIESGRPNVVAIDRREHLSVDSFRTPTPPPKSQAQDLGNFRLCCQRFADVGIPFQFSRISLRFSPSGFSRLDQISRHPHLTKHTKKFSYLVPPFYMNTLPGTNDVDRPPISRSLERRMLDQRYLLRNNEDVRVLKKAMQSFSGLQHVQLLRLIEPVEHAVRGSLVHLEWPPACSRATQTLGEALLSARSPFCRFSGPMMEPHTVRTIQQKMLSLLASRLTCLELHFDGGLELADRMREFSSLANTVFRSATQLQAIHIGFPSRTPLDVRLATVFHDIHWQNLRAFGIQAWRLDASEICEMISRHRHTLRGIRLRDVQLKDGSRWSEVLSVLRRDLRQLDWVSLRRIDYANHFDSLWNNIMEVPDETNGGASSGDSSEDSEDEEYEWPSDLSDQQSVVGSLVEDSDEDSDTGSDHGPEADDFAISPDTPTTLPCCTCDQSRDEIEPEGANELGDNGKFVTNQQRRSWERWVIGRCPEHA